MFSGGAENKARKNGGRAYKNKGRNGTFSCIGHVSRKSNSVRGNYHAFHSIAKRGDHLNCGLLPGVMVVVVNAQLHHSFDPSGSHLTTADPRVCQAGPSRPSAPNINSHTVTAERKTRKYTCRQVETIGSPAGTRHPRRLLMWTYITFQ